MNVDYIEAVALLLASDQDPSIEETQEIMEARTLVGSRPQLQAWYEEERAFYGQQDGLLSGFRLSQEAKAHMLKAMNQEALGNAPKANIVSFHRMALAAAAAVILLLGYWSFNREPQSERFVAQRGADTFDGFRDFAVSVVDQGFWLDHKSGNHQQLKEWLGSQGAPDTWDLWTNFDGLAAMGCKVLEWNGEKVSLICFKEGQGQTMHVFVANQLFPSKPLDAAPRSLEVDGRNTISWQDDLNTYVVVGHDRGQAIDQVSI